MYMRLQMAGENYQRRSVYLGKWALQSDFQRRNYNADSFQ